MAKDTGIDFIQNENNSSCNLINRKSLKSMTIEEQFESAVNVIKNLPKNGTYQPSDDLKLKFYAFYKQATIGPNNTPKPSFYDFVAKYKWEAWLKLDKMPKEDAMLGYVNELKKIVETMPLNESISDFYDKLGPFFEFKKENKNKLKKNGLSNKYVNNYTNELNYSSSSDDPSSSDDFSDTVDSLSANGDFKNDLSSIDNGFIIENKNFQNENKYVFEDCKDLSSNLKPDDIINASGNDAGYLTGQENYFFDCIDVNSVLNSDDIICARGETGIFPSRINLSSNNEQVVSRNSRQQINSDLISRTDGFSQQSLGGSSGGEDRNYNIHNSELIDIHEHLALTVLRLQQTVKSISSRIENLESKVNERQIVYPKQPIKKNNWWLNRSTQTTILLILWPFAAHFIISAIKNRKK